MNAHMSTKPARPNPLSFEPKFHRYVELEKASGWTVSVAMIGSVSALANEIVAEQSRIESEGGSILVIDFKP